MFELYPGGDDHYGVDLTPELARFDGRLFGGAGLAISVAALEATTGREALWVTTQFVGSADIGDRFDCAVEVLATGYNTSQCRLTATVDDRIVFTALGATARSRDDGFAAELGAMPQVVGPDECAPWTPAFPIEPETIAARGPFATAEFREAKTDAGDVVLWARMNGLTQDRLTLAYLGDFVPSAVLRAAGRNGGGTSLDNNIRYGAPTPEGTDWILLETEPYLAQSGYVSGACRLWSADGRLLAVTAQTAVAKLFD